MLRLIRQFVALPCLAPSAHLCLALVLDVTLMLQIYHVQWRLCIYEELQNVCCAVVGTARAPVGAHAYLCMHGPRQIHARCVCGFFQGPSMLHCTLKWVHMDNLSINKMFIDHDRYLQAHKAW